MSKKNATRQSQKKRPATSPSPGRPSRTHVKTQCKAMSTQNGRRVSEATCREPRFLSATQGVKKSAGSYNNKRARFRPYAFHRRVATTFSKSKQTVETKQQWRGQAPVTISSFKIQYYSTTILYIVTCEHSHLIFPPGVFFISRILPTPRYPALRRRDTTTYVGFSKFAWTTYYEARATRT